MIRLIRSWVSRNRQRTFYTILSVVIAFFTFVLLMALSAPFSRPKVNHSRALITINAIGGLLPMRYARRIQSVTGVHDMTHFSSLAAQCGTDEHLLPINVVGGSASGYRGNLHELPRSSVKAWKREKNALFVGDASAARCGWRAGQTVTVRPMGHKADGPVWSFRVVGIYHSEDNRGSNHNAYVHYAYINATRQEGKDQVATIETQVDRGFDIEKIAQKIDGIFAHSYPSTQTITSANAQAALARFGDVRSIILAVLGAVFFCMLLVTINVLSHAAAERLPAVALLYALGFRRYQVVALLAGEVIVIVGGGAVLGIVLGVWSIHWLQPFVVTFLTRFAVSWDVIGIGALLAAASVVLTAAVPAARVTRMNVVDYLR